MSDPPPRDGSSAAPDPTVTAPLAGRAVVLARNALAGGGRHALAAVAALLVVPFTIRHLGEARFGVWAIVGAVLAALRLLDLGLDRSLTRVVARAFGAGDPSAAAEEVAVSRALLMASAALATLVVWLLHRPLVALLFAVPPDLRAEASWAIGLTALVAWVELAWLPWRAALDGLGRMDQSHAVETGQRLLSALGVVLVLWAGGGLRALALKNLATALLAGWVLRRLLAKQAPALVASRPRFDRAKAVALLRHGRWVQAGHVASLLVEPAHKALLAHGPGLAAVAAYELGMRLASQLAGVLIALGQAIYPAAAEAAVLERQGAGGPTAGGGDSAPEPYRDALYPLATRYLAWLAWPTAAISVALAADFAATWLAGTSEPALLVQAGRGMAVLAAGAMTTVLAMPAFLMLQAADDRGARDGLIAVAAHVTLSVAGAALLVAPFGFDGVLAAAALGPVAGALAAWQRYGRRRGDGWVVLAPVLQPRVLLAAALAGLLAATGGSWSSGWTGLLLGAAAGGLGYALAMLVLRVIQPADRAVALLLWRHLRAARRTRATGSAA